MFLVTFADSASAYMDTDSCHDQRNVLRAEAIEYLRETSAIPPSELAPGGSELAHEVLHECRTALADADGQFREMFEMDMCSLSLYDTAIETCRIARDWVLLYVSMR